MNQENYRIWFEGSKGETRANIFFHEFEGERNEQRQQQREEIDRILPNSDWAAFIFLVAILASWGEIIWGIVRLAHRFFGL